MHRNNTSTKLVTLSNLYALYKKTLCMYTVAQKSKLLILAVNEINASQTRVSFAKCIPKLVEKMFDMCSIAPQRFSILYCGFVELHGSVLSADERRQTRYSQTSSETSACFDSSAVSHSMSVAFLSTLPDANNFFTSERSYRQGDQSHA